MKHLWIIFLASISTAHAADFKDEFVYFITTQPEVTVAQFTKLDAQYTGTVRTVFDLTKHIHDSLHSQSENCTVVMSASYHKGYVQKSSASKVRKSFPETVWIRAEKICDGSGKTWDIRFEVIKSACETSIKLNSTEADLVTGCDLAKVLESKRTWLEQTMDVN